LLKRVRRPAATARRAFTLVEVVIGLAAVVVVGAVIAVMTTDKRRQSRVETDIETLRDLTASIHQFDTSVSVFPSSLVQLTTRPIATDNNSCAADLLAAGVTNWANAGPFYSVPIVAPIALEIGSLQLSLTRVGATTPATIRAILQMSIASVDITDAIEVNRQVDEDVVVGNASATGTVQFAAPDPQGKTTVTWNLAVRGC
jgi:hypothetical protein